MRAHEFCAIVLARFYLDAHSRRLGLHAATLAGRSRPKNLINDALDLRLNRHDFAQRPQTPGIVGVAARRSRLERASSKMTGGVMFLKRFLSTVCVSVVAACSSSEKATPDTSAAKVPADTSTAGSTSATSAGAPQPITGKTWDVKMLGDAGGYRFDPAAIAIRRGDGVRWTVTSGVPHNVSFWADSIPAGSEAVLRANMTQASAPLVGPLLMNPSQTYTISFGSAPAGTYHYYCTPHLALGMKGTISVQ